MIPLTTAPTLGLTAAKGTAIAGTGTGAGNKVSGDDFVLSLAAFLDAMQPSAAPSVAAVEDGMSGQGDAAPGKDLPTGLPDDLVAIDPAAIASPPPLPVFAFQVPIEAVTPPVATDTQQSIGTAKPAMTTMALSMMPMMPMLQAATSEAPGARPLVAGPKSDTPPGNPAPATGAPSPAPVTIPAALTETATSPIALATAIQQQPAAGEPAPPVAPMVIDTPVAKAPVSPRPLAVAPVAPKPVAIEPTVAGTTAPAQQVFAAAIHAATADNAIEKPVADKPGDPIADIASVTTGTNGATPIAAPAMAGAKDAALDMRHERWPHSMIDHIEGLRDAADAMSTRIRLIPDALGGIDVSVQRDGDTVHVQFQAEQATTRAMLTDAQPKLAEIAEQRGLRLGDTSVSSSPTGAGLTGGQQQAPQHQQPSPRGNQPAPLSPASAFAAEPAEDDADTRIA